MPRVRESTPTAQATGGRRRDLGQQWGVATPASQREPRTCVQLAAVAALILSLVGMHQLISAQCHHATSLSSIVTHPANGHGDPPGAGQVSDAGMHADTVAPGPAALPSPTDLLSGTWGLVAACMAILLAALLGARHRTDSRRVLARPLGRSTAPPLMGTHFAQPDLHLLGVSRT